MVNREAVNCELVWREISNYLDGDVDSSLRAAMDEHMRECKRCTSVREGTRNVVVLYGDERMIEAPAGFGLRLEKRLAQNVRAGRWSTWSAWLVPVAALALMAGGLRLANSATMSEPMKSDMAQAGNSIPPDLVVLVATGTKVFHVPGCSFIHDKDKVQTMTAKEALRQGYVPCSRCLRKYLASVVGRTAFGDEASMDLDADEQDSRGRGGQ
jgi:hypothetical protein